MKRRFKLIGWPARVALLLPCAAVTAVPAQAQTATLTLHVSPAQGAAGLVDALRLARERRRDATPPAGPIRVLLAPGDYVLDEPLTLTGDDAGSAQSPLVIEAERRGTVRLLGSPRLALQTESNGAWRFAPPQPLDRADERSGGQFFVNGRRALLAREPAGGGYWFVAAPDKQVLIAQPKDAAVIAALADGDDADRAIVGVMQSWTSGEHHLAGIDAAAARLRLIPEPRWPFIYFGERQRYFVQNVPRAWNEPGEWIAADGTLNYRPRPADGSAAGAARRAEAYWPRRAHLLLLQGTAAQPVHHVQLRGLAFAYTGQPLPAGGWTDNQATAELPAAIEFEYASDVSLTDCSITHTGAWAVWLKRGVRNVDVSRCSLDDLGAGGVKIGTEQTPGEPDRTGANRIRDNVVTRIGRQFFGAVGIWIGRSFDNEVASNVVAQTSYTAISVGWSWGYDEPTSGRNRIVDNVLLDIGQYTMSDLGGVYTLGRSPGTVVSGNFISRVEDFPSYGAGAWGLYNDEGSEGIVMENNVVVGTRSGGYQLHYGRDLTVRDNFFSGGRIAEVRWANIKRSGDWRFENNGVEPRAGRGALEYYNDDAHTGQRTLRQLQAGQGFDSVQARDLAGDAGADGKPPSTGPTPGGGNARRLASWRKVAAHAQRLIDRARQAGAPIAAERLVDAAPR